ncbi:MAG: TRAP transporter small permease [Pseudomonadota bacterium]
MTWLRKLCGVHDALTDAGFVLAVLSLCLMFLTYCVEVAGRYFLGVTNAWANDMFSNFMVISIFAMVPHVTRAKQHVALVVLIEVYPVLQKPARFFTAIAGFLICALLTYMCFNENVRQVARGVMTQQNNPLPMVWWSAWLTFGFAGSSLYFLRGAFDHPALEPRSWVWRTGGAAPVTS